MTEPEFPIHIHHGERTKHRWNELGFKKLEDVMVPTKIGQRRVAVVFNARTGEFGANAAEHHFHSKDYRGLIKAIGEHFDKVSTLTFERYISIDFDVRHESTRSGYGSKSWRGSGDEDKPVSGIQLEFDVHDVSNPFDVAVHGRGGKATARVWRRLERQANGEWQTVGKEETRHENHYGGLKQMIPFTEERFQTLTSLKDGMTRIAAVLHEMFNDKALESGKAALLLDGLETQKLLPAPPPTDSKKHKKKGQSR